MGLLIDIVTPWFDLLLVDRVLQGIGTGIGLPLMYNIILAEVPKRKTRLHDGYRDDDYRLCRGLWDAR